MKASYVVVEARGLMTVKKKTSRQWGEVDRSACVARAYLPGPI